MALILPRRNPLVYPAGVAPGVNERHPAVEGLRTSCVAQGANFIDLTNGTIGTIVDSGTAWIDRNGGPITNVGVSFANKPAVQDTKMTMAAIGRFPNVPGGGHLCISNGSSGTYGHPLHGAYNGVDNNRLQWLFQGVTDRIVGNTVKDELSFVLVNCFPTATSISWSIIKSLESGHLDTLEYISYSYAAKTSDGTHLVGGPYGATCSPPFGVCAAMFSANTDLTLEEGLKWAENPWSFWYPEDRPQRTYSYYKKPTIKGGRSFPHRDPLTYPAGVTPALDMNHVAAKDQSYIAAGVATSRWFLELVTGYAGRAFSTFEDEPYLGPAMWGALGPTMQQNTYANRSLYLTPSSYTMPSTTKCTMAAICQKNAGAAGGCPVTDNLNILFYASGTTIYIQGGGLNWSSGLTWTTDVPYFVVVSADANNVNLLLKRLDTGVVKTAVKVGGITSISGRPQILGYGTSSSFDGHLAAASVANNFLSMEDLKQWAADPWSLWYPTPLNARAYAYQPTEPITIGGRGKIHRRANPFDFPVGCERHVDQSHPIVGRGDGAAWRVNCSTLAGGNFFDLVGTRRAVPGGTPQYLNTAVTGLVTRLALGGGLFTLSGFNAGTWNQGMVAAIYYQNGSSLGGGIITGGSGFGVSISSSGYFGWSGGISRTGTVQMVDADMPYFLLAGTSDTKNHTWGYSLNLLTGEIRFDSADGVNLTTWGTSQYVGPGNNNNGGHVSHVAQTTGWIDEDEAGPILADPWSVWYDVDRDYRTAFEIEAAAAAEPTGFIPAWMTSWFSRVIGRGMGV